MFSKTEVEKVARCRVCKKYVKDKRAVGFSCQHFFHKVCAEDFNHCPECKPYLRVGDIIEIHFSDGEVNYWLTVSETQILKLLSA